MSRAEPEKPSWFLFISIPMLVIGTRWVDGGMQVGELPESLRSLAMLVIIMAWWPVTYRLFPVLTRLKVVLPSFPLRAAARVLEFALFLGWALAVTQFAIFLKQPS
jgi:hypothetical protein